MSADALLRMVRVPLRECQLAALASFCAWLIERHGQEQAIEIWRRSVLLQQVNEGLTVSIGAEILNWVYTGAVIDQDLVKRRIKERMLWDGRL
jgi:GH24 family phage-related lysozyme (muramidase)